MVNGDASGLLLLYMQLASRAGIELDEMAERTYTSIAQQGSFIRSYAYYRQRSRFLCVEDYFRSKMKESGAPLH